MQPNTEKIINDTCIKVFLNLCRKFFGGGRLGGFGEIFVLGLQYFKSRYFSKFLFFQSLPNLQRLACIGPKDTSN